MNREWTGLRKNAPPSCYNYSWERRMRNLEEYGLRSNGLEWEQTSMPIL